MQKFTVGRAPIAIALAVVVVLLGTLAITIPIAALSYYAVERPLLRFKYRRQS